MFCKFFFVKLDKKNTLPLEFKFMIGISPKSILMTFSLMKLAWILKERFFYLLKIGPEKPPEFNKSEN